MLLPLVLATLVSGTTGDDPIRVGVSEVPPFVMKRGDLYTGYNIDLWNRIAQELHVTTEWVPAQNVAENLEWARYRKVDVALGAISITLDRERVVDFTHSTYKSGLTVMINEDDDRGTVPYYRFGIGFAFLLLILLAGHLMWFLERGNSQSFNNNYKEGVIDGMYWAVVTASTVGFGDKVPTRKLSKLATVCVILISLPMFSYFTAEMSSAITVSEIKSNIKSPSDLDGKVGVVRATTSVEAGAKYNLGLVQYDSAKALFEAFEKGKVRAVIYDAPVLQWYVQHNHGKLVGGLFEPQDLAFVVKEDSPLREQINQVLLLMRESGELRRLQLQWFGH